MLFDNFYKYFLSASTPLHLVSKKTPNPVLKKYIIKIRYQNYCCFSLFAYLSMLQKVVYFIQATVSAKVPLVFFFEHRPFLGVYKELTELCNEAYCFLPQAYSWLISWTPDLNIMLNASYSLASATVGIMAEPVDFFFPKVLVSKGWPLILSIPVSQSVFVSHTIDGQGSVFAVPCSELPLSGTMHYFFAAFLAKIVRLEKKRLKV